MELTAEVRVPIVFSLVTRKNVVHSILYLCITDNSTVGTGKQATTYFCFSKKKNILLLFRGQEVNTMRMYMLTK